MAINGSDYIFISNRMADQIKKQAPATSGLLFEGSTISCVAKVGLTILTCGIPLVVALTYDGALAIKHSITPAPKPEKPKKKEKSETKPETKSEPTALDHAKNYASKAVSAAKYGWSAANTVWDYTPRVIKWPILIYAGTKVVQKTIGFESGFSLTWSAVKGLFNWVVVPVATDAGSTGYEATEAALAYVNNNIPRTWEELLKYATPISEATGEKLRQGLEVVADNALPIATKVSWVSLKGVAYLGGSTASGIWNNLESIIKLAGSALVITSAISFTYNSVPWAFRAVKYGFEMLGKGVKKVVWDAPAHVGTNLFEPREIWNGFKDFISEAKNINPCSRRANTGEFVVPAGISAEGRKCLEEIRDSRTKIQVEREKYQKLVTDAAAVIIGNNDEDVLRVFESQFQEAAENIAIIDAHNKSPEQFRFEQAEEARKAAEKKTQRIKKKRNKIKILDLQNPAFFNADILRINPNAFKNHLISIDLMDEEDLDDQLEIRGIDPRTLRPRPAAALGAPAAGVAAAGVAAAGVAAPAPDGAPVPPVGYVPPLPPGLPPEPQQPGRCIVM